MLGNYLKLRAKLLLKASSQSLDIGVLIISLLVLLIFIKTNNSIWYGFISCIVLFFIHFGRKDTAFLKNILGQQFYISLITEYFLVWIAVNLFFIFKTNDFIYLGSIAFCFILPFIRFKQRFINPKLMYKIPVALLEWRSFIRKDKILFIVLFLGSFFSGYHPATLVIFLAVWIYFLLMVFSYQESKELLILQFSKKNLQKKIMYSSVFCIIFSLPALVYFFIQNPLDRIYIIYFIMFLIIINHVTIIHKYMNFNEKIKENKANDMDFFKFFIMTALIVPALIYIIYNRKIANKKIAQYV